MINMIIEMMRFWYLVLDSAVRPKGLVLHSLSLSAFLSPKHTLTQTYINSVYPCIHAKEFDMHAFNKPKIILYFIRRGFFFCYMREPPEAAGDDKPKSSHLLTGRQSKGKKKNMKKQHG